MRNIVAVMVALAVLSAGCTGSFALTKRVYTFHREQESKWMDELVFLGCVILPVYGLATLGDAIIFNTIEFWTEQNPVHAGAWRQREVVVADADTRVTMTHAPGGGQVALDMVREQESQQLIFSRSVDGVTVSDMRGTVLYISKMDDRGGVTVYDAQNNVTEHFSAKQVRLVQSSLQ